MSELSNYKNKFNQQSKVTLVSKETEIEQLHEELENVVTNSQNLIKQVNSEKELLISQNL